MRLVTLVTDEGQTLALLHKDAIIAVHAAREQVGYGAGPTTMLDLIDSGPAAWDEMHRLEAKLDGFSGTALAVQGARLAPPIPRPRKNIVCVGRNYSDHASELGNPAPGAPIFFTKAPTTVVGPDATVPYPPGVNELDFEGELALVIGTGGVNIPPEKAFQHVFGFTVMNDVTARDIQRQHVQWFKGKSFDGTCPLGPAIVTPDEITDLDSVRVRTYVNDELRQDQPVMEMIFDIPTIIAELSRGMTLQPGDIIATGTPSGVGASSKRFLKPGDRVAVHVDQVGVLQSVIGEPG